MHRYMTAPALVFLAAGGTLAQPVVDGSLEGDEGFYGPILFVQNQPTSFGDNNPANLPPSGNPGDVTTGIEFSIPLSALEIDGAFRMSGFVNSGDHTFASNQHLGGLPGLGNLGSVPAIDYNAIDGAQEVLVDPGTSATAPDVDGTLEANIYGAPIFLQNNWTGFGDATHGNVDGGSGSEIDGLYAVISGDRLYVMITGNLEANGNNLDLFFDTVAGGENSLSGSPGGVDGDALGAMAGFTLESGEGDPFEADYYMSISGESDKKGLFLTSSWLAEVGPGGDSWFLGNGFYGLGGELFDADRGAPEAEVSIDNSNTEGVIGQPPFDLPDPDVAIGSELDGVYAGVDGTDGFLYLLFTGNIESNFNKFNIFVDSMEGGQNTLRDDNVDISFGGLNGMAGLTFDTDFTPDYWVNVNTGDTPIQQFADAALLRTDGALENFNGARLDYGCFDGGLKSENNPVCFDGPNIDPQDGFTPDIYSNFAPWISWWALDQAIMKDPFDPQPIDFVVPGRLKVSIDNSNILGVTDESIEGAAEVTTGIEVAIALEELGWDGESDIKVAAFISSQGFDFFSNQTAGGLPSPDNLGDPTVLDLSQVEGDQFVVVPAGGCVADCDGNGVLNILDFVCFQTAWQNQTPFGDCDNNGVYNILDFVCYQQVFQQGCN